MQVKCIFYIAHLIVKARSIDLQECESYATKNQFSHPKKKTERRDFLSAFLLFFVFFVLYLVLVLSLVFCFVFVNVF